MNIVKLQDIKLIHRNPLHSYTLIMKKTEREIEETIPFTIATKRIKYLGINLPLPTKVHLVKAMTVVMYGCESWTVKKAEH